MMRLLMTILCVVTMFGLLACQENLATESTADTSVEIGERLRFARVEPAKQLAMMTLPAKVTVAPAFRSELSAPVSGIITKLLVPEGERIRANQPIARIQVPSLMNWKEVEASAKARLTSALRQMEITEEKLKLGLGTESELATAQAEEAEARQALQKLKANRRASEASGLKADGSGQTDLLWRAPRAGVLADIHISEGQGVTPQTTCFSLVDDSQTQVVVRVPERLLGLLSEQVKLSYVADSAYDDEAAFELELARRDALVDDSSRTLAFYFTGLGNQNNASFLPGRSGRGTLLVEAGHSLLSVPRQAVCQLQGRDGVFVDRGDVNRPEFVEVQVMGRRGEALVIHAPKLELGSRVVHSGTFLLKSIVLLSEES